jgi:hypothetical protein
MSLVLENVALGLSNAVITPTEKLQNVLGSRYGCPDKIFTMPNCAWSSNAKGYASEDPVPKDEESMVSRKEIGDCELRAGNFCKSNWIH